MMKKNGLGLNWKASHWVVCNLGMSWWVTSSCKERFFLVGKQCRWVHQVLTLIRATYRHMDRPCEFMLVCSLEDCLLTSVTY